MKITGIAVSLLIAATTAFPTTVERASVKQWDDLMVAKGFDYELYTVTTNDNWKLTLFRITGKVGETPVTSTKPPLLMMHGSQGDAAEWISYAPEGVAMPLQLAGLGYDVWMGNSRATQYSNVNSAFPDADNTSRGASYTTQNKAKYDFTFDQMGQSDLPAMINKILAVTNKPKITYIGYSQGTTEMTYGLARQEESYFVNVVAKAILLAPCLYYVEPSSTEFYQQVFLELERLGVNSANDATWSNKVAKVCAESTT